MEDYNLPADEEIANLEGMLLAFEEDEEPSVENSSKEPNVSGLLPTGDESSDDEEQRDFQSAKYNDYGREVSKKIKEDEESKKYESIRVPSTTPSRQLVHETSSVSLPQTLTHQESAVLCDPIFGLRILKPLISSATLKERMQGKTPVGVQRVRFHTERGDLSQDWVIAAVVTTKSPVRQTQKGDSFSIWTLSDLRSEIKTVTLFMFRSAHRDLWKTPTGTVIGILNPKVLEKKDEKVEAVLSVDSAQNVMILGQSKDLGICKARKVNGDPCGSIINKSDCDVCIHHMRQEYTKIRRAEFQSPRAGSGIQSLRNKVLGKSEVFYAGQSFTASNPAKKPAKMIRQDRDRLLKLSEYYSVPGSSSSQVTASPSSNQEQPVKRPRAAAMLESNGAQRKKDLERLRLLQGTDTPQIGLLTPKPEMTTLVSSQPAPKPANFVPKLSNDNLTFTLSIPARKNETAKQRAAEILKRNPLSPSNPNHIKYRGTQVGKKRASSDVLSTSGPGVNQSIAKKQKVDTDETNRRREYLISLMNKKSNHHNLVEEFEKEKQQKVFNMLEKKEAMEERMSQTTEMKVRNSFLDTTLTNHFLYPVVQSCCLSQMQVYLFFCQRSL